VSGLAYKRFMIQAPGLISTSLTKTACSEETGAVFTKPHFLVTY
jgi:hypothetical protein